MQPPPPRISTARTTFTTHASGRVHPAPRSYGGSLVDDQMDPTVYGSIADDFMDEDSGDEREHHETMHDDGGRMDTAELGSLPSTSLLMAGRHNHQYQQQYQQHLQQKQQKVPTLKRPAASTTTTHAMGAASSTLGASLINPSRVGSVRTSKIQQYKASVSFAHPSGNGGASVDRDDDGDDAQTLDPPSKRPRTLSQKHQQHQQPHQQSSSSSLAVMASFANLAVTEPPPPRVRDTVAPHDWYAKDRKAPRRTSVAAAAFSPSGRIVTFSQGHKPVVSALPPPPSSDHTGIVAYEFTAHVHLTPARAEVARTDVVRDPPVNPWTILRPVADALEIRAGPSATAPPVVTGVRQLPLHAIVAHAADPATESNRPGALVLSLLAAFLDPVVMTTESQLQSPPPPTATTAAGSQSSERSATQLVALLNQRNNVLRWLAARLRTRATDNAKAKLAVGDARGAVLALVNARQLHDACTVALKNGMPRLAIMIASAASKPVHGSGSGAARTLSLNSSKEEDPETAKERRILALLQLETTTTGQGTDLTLARSAAQALAGLDVAEALAHLLAAFPTLSVARVAAGPFAAIERDLAPVTASSSPLNLVVANLVHLAAALHPVALAPKQQAAESAAAGAYAATLAATAAGPEFTDPAATVAAVMAMSASLQIPIRDAPRLLARAGAVLEEQGHWDAAVLVALLQGAVVRGTDGMSSVAAAARAATTGARVAALVAQYASTQLPTADGRSEDSTEADTRREDRAEAHAHVPRAMLLVAKARRAAFEAGTATLPVALPNSSADQTSAARKSPTIEMARHVAARGGYIPGSTLLPVPTTRSVPMSTRKSRSVRQAEQRHVLSICAAISPAVPQVLGTAADAAYRLLPALVADGKLDEAQRTADVAARVLHESLAAAASRPAVVEHHAVVAKRVETLAKAIGSVRGYLAESGSSAASGYRIMAGLDEAHAKLVSDLELELEG
ncbi:hypothetical protein BC828DRAFT_383491, partial [Blastocladiella britannica]